MVTFALSPFLLNAATGPPPLLDYATKQGKEHFTKATEMLDPNGFALTPNDCLAMLDLFRVRATGMGWDREDGVLMITDTDGEKRNLVTEYALLTMDDILKSEEKVLAADSRDTQESYMIFQCLFNSLTRQAKSQLSLTSGDFQIAVTDGNDETIISSGPLYLKVIIREARMDSTATTIALRAKITRLPRTIYSYRHAIPKFNVHVRQIVADLAARGETANDLTDHLLKAYLTAPDSSFTDYIKRKLDLYEEGEPLDPETLLDGAKNKYNALVAVDRWKARTPEEAKIVMLEAKLNRLEQMGKNAGKRKREDGGEEKQRANPPTGSRRPNDPSTYPPWWMSTKQPADVNEKRRWEGRTYTFCCPANGGNCMRWRRHKPSDCKTKQQKKTDDTTGGGGGGGGRKRPTKTRRDANKQDGDDTRDNNKGNRRRVHFHETLVETAAEADNKDVEDDIIEKV